MAEGLDEAWSKELKVLLDKMEHRPSSVTDEDRDRVVVLQRLIRSRESASA